LAEQVDRYDSLSEDMELLRQKCKGLLGAEREDFTKQLNDIKYQARTREKKLHMENRRLADERVSEEGSFKEILSQQEEEYEDELRQLISAAENELVNERETITKLRTLVQMKNTKVDQLKKKLVELSSIFKARQGVLDQERREKEKLMETITHYKKNLQEREDALAEKERVILELRNTTRTLENFRYVLDHRLKQLSMERDPIRSHIEGLEAHIGAMYEELVDEFETKNQAADVITKKDRHIHELTAEVSRLKNVTSHQEILVEGFQRELGNIATSAIAGKELEEAVRAMYKRFVLGGKGKETKKAMNATTSKAITELMKPREEKDGEGEGKLLRTEGNGATGGTGNGGGGLLPGQVKDVEEALVETAKEVRCLVFPGMATAGQCLLLTICATLCVILMSRIRRSGNGGSWKKRAPGSSTVSRPTAPTWSGKNASGCGKTPTCCTSATTCAARY